MKITVKFDEAAGLTPAQVKIRQTEADEQRQRNRQWHQCRQTGGPVLPVVAMVAMAAFWPKGK